MAEEKEVALPEGFEIDSSEETVDSSVPEGFTVDSSEKDSKQEALDNTASKIRQFMGKSMPALIQETATGTLFKDNPLEQAVGETVSSALNTASFGIPKAIMKKVIESSGLEYPEIENKTSKTVGEFIGLISPTKVAISAVSKIPGLAGRSIAKNIMRDSIVGGTVGFTASPDEFMDISQRIKQAKIGAAVGAVAAPIVSGISNLGKVAFKSKELALKVRNSLFDTKRAIGTKFETQLDDLIAKNPAKVVNAENAFTNISSSSKENSRVISDLKLGLKKSGSTISPEVIDGFIKEPSTASQMTLNQTRELKKAISHIPSIKSNYAKGKFANFSDHDIDLLDFADEIKGSQLSSFPELADINKVYSQSMNNYNLVKNKFRFGVTLDNIQKNFGDAEVRDVVKQLLPKDIIKEMGGYRAGLKFLNAVKWIGIVGAGSTVAGAIGKKAFGSGRGESISGTG